MVSETMEMSIDFVNLNVPYMISSKQSNSDKMGFHESVSFLNLR